MRLLVAAAALALLAGCPPDTTSGMCAMDSDCGNNVCARDGECLPADQVRSVKLTWTIRGMAANAMTCAPTPDFYIQFDGDGAGDTFGYAPVPCMEGQFTIDRLPTRFGGAEMGVEGQYSSY